jgi:hypothetical protein
MIDEGTGKPQAPRSSVDLSELRSQIAQLERLLQARKKREDLRAQNEEGTSPPPRNIEGDLAELLERQNRSASGEPSERDREIEREVQLQALEMVQKLRLDIESKTNEREQRLKEIMETHR